MSRKKEAPAIGIHLGATYSCVGVWWNNQMTIIVNEHGNYTTPSCVAFTDSERLVGEAAINQAATNPSNTIYGVKRLIGRRFDDESVQADMKLCSYKIIPGQDRMPLIVVQHMGKEKRFTPEEISSMILRKMRSIAELYLGVPITDAVITVPAYFNYSQRKSTEIAGIIAGLNVLRVINEPTAAAIAYGLDEIDCFGGRPKKVLVFDLGGGTLNVSLLHISPGRIPSVIAISGEAYLGGEDFDTNMVAYFVNFIRRTKRKNLAGNAKALWRLRTACERAKRFLSSALVAEIVIESLHDGIDFSSHITRAKFEGINSDLLNRVKESVKRCLAKASTDKKDVDGVVLVGGSTHMPRIQEMLREFFDSTKMYMSINPEEVIAHGAAIYAAKLSGNCRRQDLVLDDVVAPSLGVDTSGVVVTPRKNLIQILLGMTQRKIQNPVLDVVAPISIGVETSGGVMTVVVPKNTPIPVGKEHTVTTYYDKQTSVGIRVFEGESSLTVGNNFLGELELTGIPAAPSGVPDIIVRFEIHVDGTLTVSAEERKCGRRESMTITNNMRRFRWMVLRR